MRKPIAMIIFLVWIVAYIVGVASLSAHLNALPNWVQLVFYIIAGFAWVLPLRPLFRWMNSGPGTPG